MYAFLLGLWISFCAIVSTTLFSDVTRALLVHGKVRQDTQFRSGIIGAFMRIEMMKSRWTFFYLAGALYNLSTALALVFIPMHPLVQQILSVLQGSNGVSPIVIRPEPIIAIALLGVQDTRRFLESVFITEFGNATMHAAFFVTALAHYFCIAPSVLATPASRADALSGSTLESPLFVIAGIALFLYGSYQQYVCNKILADQKRASGGKHVVPKGAWFDYVLCPLYSAELIIYFAFSVVCGLTNLMLNLVFVWVVVNQAIYALNAKQWYHDKFRGEKLAKWALVPGVW